MTPVGEGVHNGAMPDTVAPYETATGILGFEHQQYPIQLPAEFDPTPSFESGDEINYHQWRRRWLNQPPEPVHLDDVRTKSYYRDASLTFLFRMWSTLTHNSTCLAPASC